MFTRLKKIDVEENDKQIFFFSSKISSKFNYYLHYKILKFYLKLNFSNLQEVIFFKIISKSSESGISNICSSSL